MNTKLAPRILLVDDDADDRYLIKSAMIESGIALNLTECSGGEEAIEYLRDDGSPVPLLVVLDLNMPNVDGFELLKVIRKETRTKLLPVVIYSTSTDASDIKQSYSLGANSFITKPLSYEDILVTFKRICDYWLYTSCSPVDVCS